LHLQRVLDMTGTSVCLYNVVLTIVTGPMNNSSFHTCTSTFTNTKN